ncbi:MAG: hypothetical protein WCH75_22510, partial [Candidatus Binatia bacterium]
GFIRPDLNRNLRRIKSFQWAHRQAVSASEPPALILRSFGQKDSYQDAGSGFSIFGLVDAAMRETGLRPVVLGSHLSLPDDNGFLFLPTRDDEWWRIFEVYSEASSLILVIPELTQGLGQELRFLRERTWLSKTVVLMNSASVPQRVMDGQGDVHALRGNDEQRRARWSEACAIFAKMGIELPDYDPRGALIELNAQGRTRRVSILNIDPKSLNKIGYWKGLFIDAGPNTADRRERFCKVWRDMTSHRQFDGRPLSEVYVPPCLPRFGIRDVLYPPGDDGRLRVHLRIPILFGWAIPLMILLLK